MVKIMKEIETFEELQDICWSGALTQLEQIEKKGLEKELIGLLGELSDYQPFESETQLNDFIWFDLQNYEPFERLWDNDEEEENVEEQE